MPFGVPDFAALHIFQGLEYFYLNDFHTALVEFDQSLQIKESAMARYNRAYALLALGRYDEAWPDFTARYEVYRNGLTLTDVGHRLRQTLPQWKGETDARVVLLHEAGYGDTIMFLRYVQLMKKNSVVLDMPEPLRLLAAQCAPLGEEGDCWFSMFDLPGMFNVIPSPPYLMVHSALVQQWRDKIMNGVDWKVGIAWSSNTNHDGEHENQTRSLLLDLFLKLLPMQGAIFSMQQHDKEIAQSLGVHTPDMKDFADVAALMSQMDVIVSIDTAALHVAGAIGHPNVYAILPWAATWRWQDNRWYPNIKRCFSQSPGDWPSAFAQIRRES